MLDIQKRIILFLLFCIGSRLGLTLLSKKINKDLLPYLGITTLLIGISFLYLYFSNSRLNAAEGGGKTWWHNFRIVHGILYVLFSILAFQKNHKAWIVLLIDTLFGLTLFLNHHFFKLF